MDTWTQSLKDSSKYISEIEKNWETLYSSLIKHNMQPIFSGGKKSIQEMAGEAKDSSKLIEKAVKDLSQEIGSLSSGISRLESSFRKNFSQLGTSSRDVSASFSNLSVSSQKSLNETRDTFADFSQTSKEGFDLSIKGIKGLKDSADAISKAEFLPKGLTEGLKTVGQTLGIFSAGGALVSTVWEGISWVSNTFAEFQEQCRAMSREKDLEEHFGDLTLSARDLQEAAGILSQTEWTVKINTAINAQQNLQEIKGNIQGNVEELNKLDWKISVGMELTPGEQEQYQSSLNSYVQGIQEFVTQNAYSVNLAIEGIIAPNSFAFTELTEFNLDSMGGEGLYGELNNLGAELAQLVNDAFADGVLSDIELTDIQEKRQKIQEIMDEISNAEFEAKLKAIGLNSDFSQLSPESFDALMEKIRENVDEEVANADELKLELLTQAHLKYPNGGEELDKLIKQIEYQARNREVAIQLTGINFTMDGITEAYKSELDSALPEFKNEIKNQLSEMEDTIAMDGGTGQFLRNFEEKFKNGFSQLSEGTRENIRQKLQAMAPQIEDMEALAQQYKDAGEMIPKELSDSLNEIYWMEAATGNIDALYSVLAQQASGSEHYDRLMENMENCGYNVSDILCNSISQSFDESKNYVNGILAGFGLEMPAHLSNALQTMTPEIRDSALGFFSELSGGISLGMSDLQTLFQNLGMYLPSAMAENLALQTPEMQMQVINLLESMKSGIALGQEEIALLASATGLSLGDGMAQAIAGKTPDVQEQILALLGTLETASADEFPQIAAYLAEQGIMLPQTLLDSMGYSINQDGKLVETATGKVIEITDAMNELAKSAKLDAPQMAEPDGVGPLQEAYVKMKGYVDRNTIEAKVHFSYGYGGGVYFSQNANGGLVTTEQLSWIAEGDKPEMVIPLDPAKRSRALELYEQTGEALGLAAAEQRASILLNLGTAFSARSTMRPENTPVSVRIDYGRLAKELGRVLREEPIQCEPVVTVATGDIYLDDVIAGQWVDRKLSDITRRKERGG